MDGADIAESPPRTFPLLSVAMMSGASLVALLLVVWIAALLAPDVRSGLGLAPVAASAPAVLSVTVGKDDSFSPKAAEARVGSAVTFHNRQSNTLFLESAADSTNRFRFAIPSGGHTVLQLTRAGLVHFYDAASSRQLRNVSGNEVIVARHKDGQPAEGWIAVTTGSPGLRSQLTVPKENYIFTPKVLVAAVGSTIAVTNHDTNVHNFVVDPASPSGGAFIVNGADTESPTGWSRSLVVQRPGLYHFYCTLHTRIVGTQGGWHVVAALPNASGYKDHNPMEAWVVVEPATTQH